MSDEMLMEDVPYESDESEDSESDESFIEASDSDEDYGEARPRSRRVRRINRYVPVRRGVNGVRFRGPDGQVRNLPFPTKLATAAETNRGLASMEAGRRALAARLEKLESNAGQQTKKDGAATGSVYLAIGGGLTAYSLMQTSKLQPASGKFLNTWAQENSTKMAALASASQIATSGAKWLTNGRYHYSGVGIAADAIAAVQLLAFAYGSLNEGDKEISKSFKTTGELRASVGAGDFKAGEVVGADDTGNQFVVRAVAGGKFFAHLM